jgi:hypothetical protein
MSARYYHPPGPVSAKFLLSTAFIQAIMGPVGGGKTSLCLNKGVKLAQGQAPSPLAVDGRGRHKRMFKLTVVRETYRDLWRSTIPSWWQWMPQDVGVWKGSKGEPATHTIMLNPHDGTMVELIVEFGAIGDQAAEDFMRGYETTWWYLNEADRLPFDAIQYAISRAGRYPSAAHGGATTRGVMMDFNAPETEGELYDFIVDNRPADCDFFTQPGGLAPDAENIENLPGGRDYYQKMLMNPDWFVRRMVHNQFGYSRDGKPVYPEFRDLFHVSTVKLDPIPGRPIQIGIDGGGSPAAVFVQQDFSGQWRILDEVVTEQGTGPTRFGQAIARLLNERYRGFETVNDHVLLKAWADPTAFYGADKDNGEGDWIRVVEKETGLKIRPAGTNNPTQRQEAVRRPLTQLVNDGQPGLLLSSHCKALRKGFNSGYRLRKLQIPGQTRYSDEPEKNGSSHPHDGLQYALVGGGEYLEVLGRKTARSGPRPTHAVTEGGQGGGGGSQRPGRNFPVTY